MYLPPGRAAAAVGLRGIPSMLAISSTGLPVSEPVSVAEQRLLRLTGVTHSSLGPTAGGGGGGGNGGGGGGGGRDFSSNSSSRSFTKTAQLTYMYERKFCFYTEIIPDFSKTRRAALDVIKLFQILYLHGLVF